MPQATLTATVQIDISPSGVKFTIEGLDSDVCSLVFAASTFVVDTPVYRTVDTKDLTIRSNKVISFVEPPIPPVTTP